jgi:predicted HTH domain antitoxin|tara:strand:- start:727 stop:909 length:183 start_codon:yes stop_codon:yes gene_type:complete
MSEVFDLEEHITQAEKSAEDRIAALEENVIKLFQQQKIIVERFSEIVEVLDEVVGSLADE